MIEVKADGKDVTAYPLIDLKGKAYLEVKWRIVWFRKEKPLWGIETELKTEKDTCLAKATIKDECGRIMATAHKFEDKKGFIDYQEKAETGSIGRALALLGYGTANTIDLEEGERIVDSPVVSPRIETTAPSLPTDLGKYIIPYGRDKGKTFEDVPPQTLVENLSYWNSTLAKEGKPPNPVLKQYLFAISSYLLENQGPDNQEDIPL